MSLLASFPGLPTVQFLIVWRGKDRSILSCELTSVSTLVNRVGRGPSLKKPALRPYLVVSAPSAGGVSNICEA